MKEYVFYSHNGHHFEFRELTLDNKNYFKKWFKDHKYKNICGFIYMKNNRCVKNELSINYLTKGIK